MNYKKTLFSILVILSFVAVVIAAAPTTTILNPSKVVNYHVSGESLLLQWTSDANDTCVYEFNGANRTVECSAGGYNYTIQNPDVDLTEDFGSSANFYGFRFVANDQIFIDGFNKTDDDDSTRGMLRTTLEENLSTCTFSADYCAFPGGVNLTTGTTYYLVADGNGGSVTRFRNNTGAASLYSINKTWFNITGTYAAGSILTTDFYTIQGVNVSNIPNPLTPDDYLDDSLTFYSNHTNAETSIFLYNWSYNIFENSQIYNTTTFDTDSQTFVINVSYNSSYYSSISANLYYDGTAYSASRTSSGDDAIFTRNVQIPTITANTTKNFLWSFSLTNTTGTYNFNSSSVAQSVNLFSFEYCLQTASPIFLNFTFKNETGSQEIVNSTVVDSSTVYYLGDGSVNKTLTYTNSSELLNYGFCSTAPARTIYTVPSFTFKNGESQARTYNPGSLTLTNTTTTKTIFLLPTTLGQYVTFQVLNLAEQPLSNVLLEFSRSGFSGNVAKTITGASGTASVFLNPDVTYTLTASKTGFSTFSASQTFPTTEFTIILGGSSTSNATDYNQGMLPNILPKDQVLDNSTYYFFNFTLNSTVLSLDEFGFTLGNGTVIFASNSSTSSNGGTLNLNLSTGNNQSIILNYYWVVDGVYTNGSIPYSVEDYLFRPYSIWQFFENFKNYISGGLFGANSWTLAVIGFLIILITTGIFSYKFGLGSPAAIAGVSLFVTLLVDVGLGMIPKFGPFGGHALTVFMLLIFLVTLMREVIR